MDLELLWALEQTKGGTDEQTYIQSSRGHNEPH